MMKCRGMGAAMRKLGGGMMKPVAMKEGKMVERKQMGQGISRLAPPPMGKVVDAGSPRSIAPKAPVYKSPVPERNPMRTPAKSAAKSERSSMSDRRAYGKMIKRKMKGKSC
jgi:hypothetical protein